MIGNQQSKILLYLIMTLGLVLGFLYSSGSDPAADIAPLDIRLQVTSLQSLRNVRIDQSILTAEAFTSLRVFGALPVQPIAGGKSDPFQ